MSGTDAPFDPKPVPLEGAAARLVPLDLSHAAGLYEAGREEETWRWLARPPFRDVEDARAWIAEALAGLASGDEAPFAVFEAAGVRGLRGKEGPGSAAVPGPGAGGAGPIGSTRFMDIRRPDRGLEIGWTWLGAAHRRTAVNTECKYLLLRHAFEDLAAHRVMFKTDLRNEASQRAIERIGAVREGVFRKHRVVRDGFLRHSVFYSIVDDEWPLVKEHLERLMRR